MYKLIEYRKNYSKISRSLWNYYRNEPNSGVDGENNNVSYSIKDSKYFDYNTNTKGKLEGIDRIKNVEIGVPLTLGMPLINCKVSLILNWSEKFVLTSIATRDAIPAQGGNPQ